LTISIVTTLAVGSLTITPLQISSFVWQLKMRIDQYLIKW